jgi:release factor glutamine methyltransferase
MEKNLRNVPDPDLSHIHSKYYQRVYEPGDDTFLLMTALDQTLRLGEFQGFVFILEIGPGTGIVSSHANNLIKSLGIQVFSFAVELNPVAAEICKLTLDQNRNLGDVVIGNLSDCLIERLAHKVDVLIFNPPYVPSPVEEIGPQFQRSNSDSLISAAWAGGDRGRQVIDQFIPCVERLLSPNGVLYLVLILENDPDEIISTLKKRYQIESTVINSKPSVREHLVILKCQFSK